MTRHRVSTIPLAPAERLKVDKFFEKAPGATSYGYAIIDMGNDRVLTSGVGFTTARSRDDALATGRRRVLGERPREAGPATSFLSASCRGLLRAMVNRTWGTDE